MHRIAVLSLVLVVAACSPAPAPEPAVPPKVAVEKAPPPPVPQLGPIPMEYTEPVVGGARMAAGSDILSSLAASKEHTFLVAGLQASGLAESLAGAGPFTLFAPSDAAFKRITPDPRALLEPAKHDELVRLLGYHIVLEKLDADELGRRVMAGNGSASLTTLEGGTIKVTVGNGRAMLIDGKGVAVGISTPNVLQSNGVIQVIDAVLSPP